MKSIQYILLFTGFCLLNAKCKLSEATNNNNKTIKQLIKTYRGNHDLAFASYLKTCLLSNKTVVIPASTTLNLSIGNIPITGNLKITGGGTIQSKGQNNLFRIEDGASIFIESIKFRNFNCILKAGKRDLSFDLTADSLQLENCQSLIFSGTNNTERKKVGPISIQNSMFKNCKGPIIEIRNLHLNDVDISNNHFINTDQINAKSAVIEIGAGTNKSNAKNIKITNNFIDNFSFVDKACAIIVHGASNVKIEQNKISNIRSLAKEKQTYGIYIKASKASIIQNELQDAGDGEAAIINKGLAKNHALTTPGTVLGDQVLIEDNIISYTDAYHSVAKKSITGITVTGTNQVVKNNTITNVSNGIELRSGPIKKGVIYEGGFQILGNRIQKLQHHSNKTSVVRGISIMQASRNILIDNNEITFTKDILINPKFIFGITGLNNADTKNIKIEKNKIKNKIPNKLTKTSFAVNFRTKGIVEELSIYNNKIDGFSFGVTLNDNDNQSVYKQVDIDNEYRNISKKELRQVITQPNRHSIRFKKE